VRLLVNTELMIEDRGRVMPSVGGLLLFGLRPKRFLPQSGITAVAYFYFVRLKLAITG